MEAHAFLSCSGANAWINCAAYPSVSALFPDDQDDEAARQGTAAHWLLELFLESYRIGKVLDLDEYLDVQAPNGIHIDEEMIDCVMESAREVFLIFENNPDKSLTLYLEYRLEVPAVHAHKCWGTADIIIVDEKSAHVWVLDFKYGHLYVEPWFNWQLMLYAAGAWSKLLYGRKGVTFELQTLQPRSYRAAKSKPWVLGDDELSQYIAQARDAALLALDKNPSATTGKHCYYCPARHACNAYLQQSELCLEIADMPSIAVPSADAVGVELTMIARAVDILQARKIALTVEAERYLKNGSDVSGWSMENTRTSLKWHKHDTEIIALGKTLKIDLRKPETVVTPTQAQKLGLPVSVVQRYANRISTGMVLKPFNSLKTLKLFRKEL